MIGATGVSSDQWGGDEKVPEGGRAATRTTAVTGHYVENNCTTQTFGSQVPCPLDRATRRARRSPHLRISSEVDPAESQARSPMQRGNVRQRKNGGEANCQAQPGGMYRLKRKNKKRAQGTRRGRGAQRGVDRVEGEQAGVLNLGAEKRIGVERRFGARRRRAGSLCVSVCVCIPRAGGNVAATTPLLHEPRRETALGQWRFLLSGRKQKPDAGVQR